MITNQTILDLARKLGFDLVGFAKAEQLHNETEKLSRWIELGYQSKMAYMEQNHDKRNDVSLILENAESVISLGMNYYVHGSYSGKDGYGKVSRYAWGKDYDDSFEAKSYVDTGPVMDRAWAVKAGIGWLGKHTNVISRDIGSWFFIANIITNHKFEYNEPLTDFCGSCTACIDECPTDAIVDEYVLDSNKCISNLTIENKGDIPEKFKGHFENWIFGCDICQDVCPWNDKFAFKKERSEFRPVINIELNLDEVKNMTGSRFKQRFAVSPINRARLKGLKRNAEFISGK
jgi:epoxyqueuosine reductase